MTQCIRSIASCTGWETTIRSTDSNTALSEEFGI